MLWAAARRDRVAGDRALSGQLAQVAVATTRSDAALHDDDRGAWPAGQDVTAWVSGSTVKSPAVEHPPADFCWARQERPS